MKTTVTGLITMLLLTTVSPRGWNRLTDAVRSRRLGRRHPAGGAGGAGDQP